MINKSSIIHEVDTVYQWLSEQLADLNQPCSACGNCCDFESFGHKLYVTTPELIYFRHHHGPDLKEMKTDICPYRIDEKCSVYPYRFSGCRIFSCKGDAEKENAICEQAVRRFKTLCKDHAIPYHYTDLKTGLQLLKENRKLKI